MFRNELEIHIPTDEEEAAIQREIALDPDAPEWTDKDWARARPAIEVDPELVEYHLARKTAQEYRNKGYDVSTEVPLDFLPGFRADMVVSKGCESKVIEVKSWSSLVADSRLAQLANIIDSKPGWTLELIFVGEPEKRHTPANPRVPERERILQQIEQAEKTLDSGRLETAFALAWSACAAATKALVAAEGVSDPDIAPATYVLNQPRCLGIISKGERLNRNNLRKYRNVIAQDFRHKDLTADMVASLTPVAHYMANQIPARQYAQSSI